MKYIHKRHAGVSVKSAILPLLMLLPLTAFAQSAINYAKTPYGVKAATEISGGNNATEIQFAIEGRETPAKTKAPAFTLQTGQPIHEALQAWSAGADWTLNWLPSVSWKTLRGTTYNQPDVVAAVSEVIETLRFEGKPIALRVSDGNKVMEVISTEVRND